MSKLPKEHKFIDLSDYGRPLARLIANSLKETSYTPIDVTIWFIISGLIAVACILLEYYWAAGLFLLFKSILDAADGELARVRGTPSYTGRYLDSVADILLNMLIFIALWYISEVHFIYCLLAFLGIQLQGTLYNYYYVIMRNHLNGDTTSRIFENETPTALEGETQKNVTILFGVYKALYGVFDRTIYALDGDASTGKRLPNIVMTALSTFGLGFQLLIISVMLVLGYKEYIVYFFLWYSMMIFVFIGIRRLI
jgi:hypothetical protein